METDWIYGLAGGLMIGLAGAIYLLGNGRIMGASGLLGGIVDGTDRRGERWAFLGGLIGVPALWALTLGPFDSHVTTAPGLLIAAGLLVGFGTRIANGCTSGHGVCGISRLSVRGIVATLFYLGAGFMTMYAARHLWGLI
ncbi:YeeE/YedE family protein [Primorskyibacter sp. S187A]|uniref:YeeE/YedE family protein n=1 Tax=Primorskyibacter sp. S187A TaxID=3415130 RepID=UPI003C7CDC24